MPGKPSPKKKGGGKKKQTRESNGDLNLMAVLIEEGRSIRPEVQQLVETSIEDNHEIITVLMNLILSSCGVEGRIDNWQVKANDIDTVLKELSELVPDHVAERYPLISRDKKWKRFRVSYPKFWKEIASAAIANDSIYESDFIQILLKWICGLSLSKVRSFRHQSMVAVYNLVSVMVTNAKKLHDLLSQITNGKKKGESKKKKTEIQNKLNTLTSLITEAVSASCLQRFRDVIPELRAVTLQYLSEWTEAFPSFFYDFSYTRSFGWLLYDKDDSVRLAAVQSLEKIYSLDDSHVRMRPFTERYKARIQQMTFDSNVSVSQAAVLLCGKLIYNGCTSREEVFQPDIHAGLLELVRDEKLGIRQAAGGLFKLILKDRTYTRLGHEVGGDTKPTPKESSHTQLDLMLIWLQGTESAASADAMVDSLTYHGAERQFKHFDRIAEIALSDNPKELLQVDDDDTSDLAITQSALQLLLAIVKRASGKLNLKIPGDHAPALAPKSKRKEVDASWVSIKKRLEEYLPTFITDMLVKTLADPQSERCLLQMVQLLSADSWSRGGKKQEDKLDTLLECCQKVVLKSTDEDTITAGTCAFRHLIKSKHDLQEKCEESWTDVVTTLKKAIPNTNSKKKIWLRIAIALDCGMDITDTIWTQLMLAFSDSETLENHKECSHILTSSTDSLVLRSHRSLALNDDSFDLRQDFLGIVLPMYELLDRASLEIRKIVFKSLSILWPLGCCSELLSPPDDDVQRLFVSTFSEVVVDFPHHDKVITEAENTLRQSEVECFLMGMIRLIPLGLLNDRWVAELYIKWPFLHQKGQDLVKSLHSHLSIFDVAWTHEVDAIQLAHHRLKIAHDDDSPDAEDCEQVLLELSKRLALCNSFSSNKEGVVKLLTKIESMAADNRDFHFVLYAVIPFIRFLSVPATKRLLTIVRSREYENSEPALAFIRQLMKRAGEVLPDSQDAAPKKSNKKTAGGTKGRVKVKPAAEQESDEEDQPMKKRVKTPTAKKGKTTITSSQKEKGKTSSAPPSSLKKRTVNQVLLEDEEESISSEDDKFTLKSYNSQSQTSKRIERQTVSSPSGTQRVRLSLADQSMTFEEDATPRKSTTDLSQDLSINFSPDESEVSNTQKRRKSSKSTANDSVVGASQRSGKSVRISQTTQQNIFDDTQEESNDSDDEINIFGGDDSSVGMSQTSSKRMSQSSQSTKYRMSEASNPVIQTRRRRK